MDSGLFHHFKHEKIRAVMNLIHKDFQSTLKTKSDLPIVFQEPTKVAKHTYRTECKVVLAEGKAYPIGMFTGAIVKSGKSTAFVLKPEYHHEFCNMTVRTNDVIYFGLRTDKNVESYDDASVDLIFDIDTKHLNYIVYDDPTVQKEKGDE